MRIITAALVLAVPLTACKKAENKKAEPPAPAASPVAAAPAPAPAPAPPTDFKLTVTSGFEDIAGSYDGAKGILIKAENTQLLAIVKDCPAFDCDFVGWYGSATDTMTKACPKATFLAITLGDDKHKVTLKPGPTQAKIDAAIPGGGSMVAGPDFDDVGLKLTQVSADTITGTIDYKGDPTAVNGAFKAKVCPPAAN